MTRLAVFRAAAMVTGAVVVAAVAACDDKPQHPTAPQAVAAAVTESPALAPAGGSGGLSTVCLAYINKQSVAQEKLEAAKAKPEAAEAIEELQTKVTKLDAMVADACH